MKNNRKEKIKDWREKKNYLFFNKNYLSCFYNDLNLYKIKPKVIHNTSIDYSSIEVRRQMSKQMVTWWNSLTFEEYVAFCLKRKKSRKYMGSCNNSKEWVKFVLKNRKIVPRKYNYNRQKNIRSILIEVEHIRKPNYYGVLNQKDFNSIW